VISAKTKHASVKPLNIIYHITVMIPDSWTVFSNHICLSVVVSVCLSLCMFLCLSV